MWIDAHNHLHDARLPPTDASTIAAYRDRGIDKMVVNGTCEQDWPDVADLARRFPDFILPSFGLHPWKVTTASRDWQSSLRGYLAGFPHAPVGEIGLDQWIPNPDLRGQADAFAWQCQLAADYDRPITIHCLKAWDSLFSLWPTLPARPGRVLIHGFTGSPDLASSLVRRGCLLGFGGHALVPRKHTARQAFAAIPADALMLETDAPDMPAPPDIRTDFLADQRLNHPANLVAHGLALAALRQSSPADLAVQLQANFQRWRMG